MTAVARLPAGAFPVHQHRRGKYDEKLLRARHSEGSLDVVINDEAPAAASAT